MQLIKMSTFCTTKFYQKKYKKMDRMEMKTQTNKCPFSIIIHHRNPIEMRSKKKERKKRCSDNID